MLVAHALKIGKIADGDTPPTYQAMHYARFAANFAEVNDKLTMLDFSII